MSERSFTVVVRVRGDVGISDTQAIREVNDLLAFAKKAARCLPDDSDAIEIWTVVNEYQVQAAPVPEAVLNDIVDANIATLESLTSAPSASSSWEPPGGLKRPARSQRRRKR